MILAWPVSRNLIWKGPPLVKEGHFFGGKATFKFSFTSLLYLSLPKVFLETKGGSKCSFTVITHSLEVHFLKFYGRSIASLKFKGVFKVSFKEGGFAKLRFLKGGRNSRKSLNLR